MRYILTGLQYALVNRTMTYASVRRPIRLKFGQRLFLRAVPILFLLHCTMRLLSALRCQCPNSYPLPWPEPCITSAQNVLWYTFKCTCLSYFIDTFCASLEMRTAPGDNGMTVVEYAFAFAETANLTPTPEVLIAALLSVTGTLINSHIVALFNWHTYRVHYPPNNCTNTQLIPTMLHGVISLVYFIYTIISGRFIQLPSILLLFQIPYILTLVLLLMCTAISLTATLLIGRRDLRTSIFDGGVGIPGLNEDFYAWLFKWGVIALTSVQEATFLNENESLRMPTTTIVESQDEQDLEEENAIRSGIGFRREWIRTGTVSKNRSNGMPTRAQNFRSALLYVRATFRTYLALALRYLRGEEPPRMRMRANTPYSTRGTTPYDEEEDEDYVFSDRESSPVDFEESSDEEEDDDDFLRRDASISPTMRPTARNIREASPFNREFREPSPFLNQTVHRSDSSRRAREMTPFDIEEPNPPSSYNANPPTFDDADDEGEESQNLITELFPDLASTISSIFRPSSQAESEDSQVFISHMSSDRVLTRSRYREESESQRLEKLIRFRRPRRSSSNTTDDDYYVAEVQKCAVCRTNPRVIVIWPCRFVF